MLTDEMKENLVKRIKAVEKIDKILLFGSEATGTATADSDIDLLVVLDSMTIPTSFRERSANHLLVSRAIRDIEKKHPIDLLVYTRSEFEQLKARDSQFIHRILHDGVDLS